MKIFLDNMMIIRYMSLPLPVDYRIVRKIIILIIGILMIYYLIHDKYISNRSNSGENRNDLLKNTLNITSNIHIIDLTAPIKTKFDCIKTKTLLRNFSTYLCLHRINKDKYISGTFQNSTSIWEEDQVTRILELLIRYPHLHFIDIGANIGTYTMFVTALGRFVLAIDCFAPNLVRLARAIQLADVADRVVLVQNALFTHSDQMLRLSVDTINIGGQGIFVSGNSSPRHRAIKNTSTQNPYIVKTITFDELLPILVARGIRGVLIKMDIEGSESFVVQSGGRIFDTLDIPFIQMEWKVVRRYADRANVIIDFFDRRHYDSMTSSCQLLNSLEYNQWPDEIYWLRRNVSNFC